MLLSWNQWFQYDPLLIRQAGLVPFALDDQSTFNVIDDKLRAQTSFRGSFVSIQLSLRPLRNRPSTREAAFNTPSKVLSELPEDKLLQNHYRFYM